MSKNEIIRVENVRREEDDAVFAGITSAVDDQISTKLKEFEERQTTTLHDAILKALGKRRNDDPSGGSNSKKKKKEPTFNSKGNETRFNENQEVTRKN